MILLVVSEIENLHDFDRNANSRFGFRNIDAYASSQSFWKDAGVIGQGGLSGASSQAEFDLQNSPLPAPSSSVSIVSVAEELREVSIICNCKVCNCFINIQIFFIV